MMKSVAIAGYFPRFADSLTGQRFNKTVLLVTWQSAKITLLIVTLLVSDNMHK
jgi:hypothetical protein